MPRQLILGLPISFSASQFINTESANKEDQPCGLSWFPRLTLALKDLPKITQQPVWLISCQTWVLAVLFFRKLSDTPKWTKYSAYSNVYHSDSTVSRP